MLAPLLPLDQLRSQRRSEAGIESQIRARLLARLDETVGACPTGRPRGLVSLILPLPLGLCTAPELPPEIDVPRFGLVHPRGEELHGGYGVAAERLESGPQGLRRLREQALALTRDWALVDPDATGARAFALLGLAADPGREPWTPGDWPGAERPDALLWVPELGISTRRGETHLVLSAPLPQSPQALRARWGEWIGRLAAALADPGPEPLPPAGLRALESLPRVGDWCERVRLTLGEIRKGPLEKAVLARRLELKGQRPFDLQRLQAALARLFPECRLLHIRRGTTSLVAATPERLVSVRGDLAQIDAIAGTAARGASPARDLALADALRRSAKDRREHRLVVESIRAALAGACTSVELPSTPAVIKLHNAQHLWSPIRARRLPGTDLFDLALRLHPTPATGGTPRRDAGLWLRRIEPIPRGWYTGAAGILELGQTRDRERVPDGELWVLLRCAEVRGDRARLYAGAGIVAGSVPLVEWRETGRKLAAVATALRLA